jgi:hypothetical protein
VPKKYKWNRPRQTSRQLKVGRKCPDRSSESLKKGVLLMSKENSTECVLVGPGHNLPSGIELASLNQVPFTESITYLDLDVFRIGTCSCGYPEETRDSEDWSRFSSVMPRRGWGFRISNEDETPSDPFPHKDKTAGCQELFTVHDSSTLRQLVESSEEVSFAEILLGYPHTRVLLDLETGQTFWLKGNDGSIVQQTPVFYVTRGRQHGCTDFSWYEHPINGPVFSPCINQEGK